MPTLSRNRTFPRQRATEEQAYSLTAKPGQVFKYEQKNMFDKTWTLWYNS